MGVGGRNAGSCNKRGSRVCDPAGTVRTGRSGRRFVEFFTANIRNPNTRKAYARAAAAFAAWCDQNGLHELRDIEPLHVAAYVESPTRLYAAQSEKCY